MVGASGYDDGRGEGKGERETRGIDSPPHLRRRRRREAPPRRLAESGGAVEYGRGRELAGEVRSETLFWRSEQQRRSNGSR